MRDNPLLARFMAGECALITPGREDWFRSCLHAATAEPRLGELLAEASSMRGMMIAAADGDDGFWYSPDDWRASYRPYVVTDGVLQIPVKGVLLHDFPWALGGWATGYQYIWRAFERGMRDNGVRAIALMCDSPGGMVAGCFELVDKMFAMRGTKPIRSFAHESAYSAAYAVASAADHIAVSRTGGVGSIGVVTYHVNFSGALEQQGIEITFIFAGKHKVDGNSTEKLSDDARKRIQAHIDDIYSVFVASVARNRGLSERKVRATEALCYSAPDAVEIKLADSIAARDDAVAAFVAELNTPNPETGDPQMTTNKDSVTLAEHQAAVAAARTEGEAAGRAAATTEASTAERARCKGILGHAEAVGREKMAHHLAFNTSMSIEDAAGLMAASPKLEPKSADAERPRDRLDEALTGKNPDVGADGDAAEAPKKGTRERGAAIVAEMFPKKDKAA